MSAIIKSIISLFLILLVGLYGSKKKIITTEINKGFIELLLRIVLPIMILSSFVFSYSDTIKYNALKTFYYSFLAYIIIIILSYFLTKPVKNDKRSILHFANVFTNTGFVGFPILNVVYGPEAVIYGSIFNTFFVLFLWTYGIMIFKGNMDRGQLKKEITKALLNPSVVAVYIGVFMMFLNIGMPEVIASTLSAVGSMTSPLSMIIVGAILSNINVRDYIKDWTMYYGMFLKLILLPMLIFMISILIKDRSIVTNSIIILVAMPPAAMTSIFAENFNFQRDYATVVMVVFTLVSILTVPILLKIIL